MPGIKVFEHHVGKCFEHHVAPPISSKLNGSAARGTEVLIRGAGPCRRGVPPWLRQVESYLNAAGMAAWRLPGRWPDGDGRRTVARRTRRRVAPAYSPIPDPSLAHVFSSKTMNTAIFRIAGHRTRP